MYDIYTFLLLWKERFWVFSSQTVTQPLKAMLQKFAIESTKYILVHENIEVTATKDYRSLVFQGPVATQAVILGYYNKCNH